LKQIVAGTMVQCAPRPTVVCLLQLYTALTSMCPLVALKVDDAAAPIEVGFIGPQGGLVAGSGTSWCKVGASSDAEAVHPLPLTALVPLVKTDDIIPMRPKAPFRGWAFATNLSNATLYPAGTVRRGR
jgi:hypothetical protein